MDAAINTKFKTALAPAPVLGVVVAYTACADAVLVQKKKTKDAYTATRVIVENSFVIIRGCNYCRSSVSYMTNTLLDQESQYFRSVVKRP